MDRMSRAAGWLALLALLATRPLAGIVVEEVEAGRAGDQAGVQAGDLLTGWKVTAPREEQGPLTSPHDLRRVEMEQAPLGRVTLLGQRGDVSLELVVPPGAWRVTARPRLSPEMEAGYQAAAAQAEAGQSVEAAGRLERLSAAAPGPVQQAWLLHQAAVWSSEAEASEEARRLFDAAAGIARAAGGDDLVAALREAEGRHWFEKTRHDEALEALGIALALRQQGGDPSLAAAVTHLEIGEVAQRKGDLESAKTHLETAVAAYEALAPGSMELARSLNVLGYVFQRHLGAEDLELAETLQRRALAIQEGLAPGGIDVAASHNYLGNLALAREDPAAGIEHYERALTIWEQRMPGSSFHASVLGNLGNTAWMRGDLARAGGYFEKALAINQKRTPDGMFVSNNLNGLGAVAFMRGDLAAADEYLRRTVAIRERLAPDSDRLALVINNQGTVALKRGDLEAAERHFRRSLEMTERIKPRSLDVAYRLDSLGHLALRRGRLDEAQDLLSRALEIKREIAPDTGTVAQTLLGWAKLREERGDLPSARRALDEALAIYSTEASEALPVAQALDALARLASLQGDLDAARAQHRRALAIRERLAPGSADEAESAAGLARALQGENPVEAVDHFYRAIDALEAQQGRLGGDDEVRSAFRSSHMDIYRDLIDLLIALGRQEEALHVLERSRARGLLSLLGERDLVFAADIPPDLDERRRILAQEYDRAQSALAGLAPEKDSEALAGLQEKLEGIRRQQAEVREEIRRHAPRLAALQSTDALDLAGIRKGIDPGTVVVLFSVGRDRTQLLAVDRGGAARSWTMPLGEDELRRRVLAFRASIEASRQPAGLESLMRAAADLYTDLLGPADGTLEAAERLLIIPDGPLHLLPFAALRRPADRGGGAAGAGGYLVEWKPLYLAVSVTVHAQLREARRSGPREAELLAFGDPLYRPAGGVGAGSGEVRALGPIPATRDEVQAIAGLFQGRARALLGPEATETRARAAGRGPEMIHFAAHAVMDENVPLDSAIVLSTPETVEFGSDNGLLQAWEVFESVRLDASLVVLSGCETALGREVAGEGMVGLTRAFQYAGARSVLASQWSVTDRSTAELMKQFYTHLRAGKAKDEALRLAQLALIRSAAVDALPGAGAGGDAGAAGDGQESPRGVTRLASGREGATTHAAPYYWAAFQLIGDRR